MQCNASHAGHPVAIPNIRMAPDKQETIPITSSPRAQRIAIAFSANSAPIFSIIYFCFKFECRLLLLKFLVRGTSIFFFAIARFAWILGEARQSNKQRGKGGDDLTHWENACTYYISFLFIISRQIGAPESKVCRANSHGRTYTFLCAVSRMARRDTGNDWAELGWIRCR